MPPSRETFMGPQDLTSCHRFRSNQVWLALSLLAYNLGNLWRRLVLPKRIENWSLPSLQQRLVKTGGRLVKHVGEQWDGCMISAVFEPKRKFRLGGTMVNSPPHPFVFRCMDQELAPLRTRREFLSSRDSLRAPRRAAIGPGRRDQARCQCSPRFEMATSTLPLKAQLSSWAACAPSPKARNASC